MLSSLASLKSLIKLKDYHIDYGVFRLHYHGTVTLLFGFSLILSTKVLFGDPIDCSSRMGGDAGMYDNICYSTGTYTQYNVDRSELNSTYGQELIKNEPFRLVKRILKNRNITYKPLEKYYSSGLAIPRGASVYEATYWHMYYNYMPIILFLMGLFFYVPHFLWKKWEAGIVSSMCKEIHLSRFKESDYTDIKKYLRSTFGIKRHWSLVYKYIFCEFLLIANIIAQIFVVNHILNDQFITYGTDYIQYYFDENLYGMQAIKQDKDVKYDINNPLDMVFPKLTKCTVRWPSQAGNALDLKQFVCSLPLNILHDKFFLIIWAWLAILTVVTVIQFILDLLYIVIPLSRQTLFRWKFGLKTHSGYWIPDTLSELFILDLVGSNSDRVAFMAFLVQMDKESWTHKHQSSVEL